MSAVPLGLHVILCPQASVEDVLDKRALPIEAWARLAVCLAPARAPPVWTITDGSWPQGAT